MNAPSAEGRPPLQVAVCGRDWVGGRDYQEDRHGFAWLEKTEPRQLAVVLCDGMGGHAAGHVASQTALDAAMAALLAAPDAPPRKRLIDALGAANRAIGAKVKANSGLRGMGCTLVALLLIGRKLHWISVGDSPMWRYDGNLLTRLNAEHSLKMRLEEQVRKGEITAEDAASHPQRNALISAVMGSEVELYDQQEVTLRRGDVVVLASDGIETLSPERIERVLAEQDGHDPHDPHDLADALMNAVKAHAAGKQDNTTIVAISTGRRRQVTASRPRDRFAVPPWLFAGSTATAALLGVLLYLLLTGGETDESVAATDPVAGAVVEPDCILESVERQAPGGLAQVCGCIAEGRNADVAEGMRDPVILREFDDCKANGGRLPEPEEARDRAEDNIDGTGSPEPSNPENAGRNNDTVDGDTAAPAVTDDTADAEDGRTDPAQAEAAPTGQAPSDAVQPDTDAPSDPSVGTPSERHRPERPDRSTGR